LSGGGRQLNKGRDDAQSTRILAAGLSRRGRSAATVSGETHNNDKAFHDALEWRIPQLVQLQKTEVTHRLMIMYLGAPRSRSLITFSILDIS
jgi:hypothetical protein